MMTEILTGKQVLALLAQDEVPEIEFRFDSDWIWEPFSVTEWKLETLLSTSKEFRIKPKSQRRISVTLANGEVISWPEPVREELKVDREYWFVESDGTVSKLWWSGHRLDKDHLAFGNVHLTREAAQEHADALRKINTQGVVCA